MFLPQRWRGKNAAMTFGGMVLITTLWKKTWRNYALPSNRNVGIQYMSFPPLTNQKWKTGDAVLFEEVFVKKNKRMKKIAKSFISFVGKVKNGINRMLSSFLSPIKNQRTGIAETFGRIFETSLWKKSKKFNDVFRNVIHKKMPGVFFILSRMCVVYDILYVLYNAYTTIGGHASFSSEVCAHDQRTSFVCEQPVQFVSNPEDHFGLKSVVVIKWCRRRCGAILQISIARLNYVLRCQLVIDFRAPDRSRRVTSDGSKMDRTGCSRESIIYGRRSSLRAMMLL